ncbi:MAG: response regulator [Myxacorys chilensis ATA2-1-KO14]|jgi:PAS domain S-box-containing protein|nr:response regulator [Myxacorys chilensis ATA2-1-KO14]
MADQGVVLIVDDTLTNLEVLFDSLINADFKILVAEDGESAIDTANYALPDLILLDILMPDIDGFETFRRLKANHATADIPVIFMTALSETVDKVKGFALGAVDYITKPFQQEEVLARVQTHLRLRQLTKQLQEQMAREQAIRAEAEAERSRATNILESITDGFFALDQEWRFTYLNPQAEPLLQRKREDLLGKNIWDEFPEAIHSPFYQKYHRVATQQISVEFEEFYPPLNVWFAVHAYPAKNGISVYFQDITTRRMAQEELQRQYQRSQLFAEVTLEIRQSLNLDEILQTAVTEVQRILQADRVLIYQLWADGSGSGVAEEVLPGWSPVLGRKFPEEVFPIEYREQYRQGRVCNIPDVTDQKEHVPSCLIEFVQQFQVKAKLVVPILIKSELWGLLIAHQCGAPRSWTSFEAELLQQLADQIGIAITQGQLLDQETRQRQELGRSNADLQQFAYIASHDLQEPLRMITSYLQLLERRYKDRLDENASEFIGYAVEGAARMKTLINDLLAYSRVGTHGKAFEHIDCTASVKQAIANLKLSIAENQATITWDELPEVVADSTQLTQLFQNLISNAIKFRSVVPPTIHISAISQAENWLFRVQDNGIGIEAQYADRVFVIFQRLHNRAEYPGTGIGLAICKKIIERHDGTIWIESEPGKGSTFCFTIPEQA